jgi:hypothetical protein
MRGWLILFVTVFGIGVASAEPPKTSIRPMSRPATVQPLAADLPVETLLAAAPEMSRIRPLRRPEAQPVAAPEKPRKGLLGLLGPRAKPAKKPKISRKGSVCGDPSIKGETIARITSKTRGCGIDDPVRVTSVNGVRLSQAATIDCPTARALNAWVETGLQPAFGRTKVVELKVAAHYSCRTRNNVRGAKISEHGRGKAIDISGFVLSNGKEISVQGNFNKTIRKAHKAACGIFKTTLGPGSDGYHEDHLHFDTASHRSGTYCR